VDCIFCKIVAGEIPSIKVYEDEATLAFMDINPLGEGHVLLVPKRHFVGLFDADDEAMGHVMAAAARVARAMKSVLGIDSMNLLQANGRWAAQSVLHFHVHLIPRRENDGLGMDWGLAPGDVDAIRKTGEAIAAAVT
jgi:histidine triad (HIT) family protein